jgi:hypothetical protein
MTSDYIYTPVVRETTLDRMTNWLSDVFYGSFTGQLLVQGAFFIAGCATIAAVVFVAAA